MSVVIEEFDMDDMTFTVLGRIEGGEVVDDKSGFLSELLDNEDLSDEHELLDRFNGPRLIAYPDTRTVGKKWIPYEGPRGGEGWQNVNDPDDIRYGLDEAPGEVADGYDEDHWSKYPSDEDWPDSPFGTGWKEPTGFGRSGGMSEKDALMFVNYDDEFQVGRIREFRPDENLYELEGGYVIGHSQVLGFSEPDPESRIETSQGMVVEGDWITYKKTYHLAGDHSPTDTRTGRVTGIEHNEGHDVISVIGEGGYEDIEVTGQEHNRNEYNAAIEEIHRDTPPLFENVEENGMEMETETIVNEITEKVDLSADGSFRPSHSQLEQEKRKEIRRELERYFPKQYVDAYYGAISSWKNNNASGSAQEHEMAFKEVLDIESPTHAEELHGKNPSSPAKAHEKIAEVMAELSNEFWEENFGGSQRVHRGISNTAFEELFTTWLENPNATEFDLKQLTLNNYSIEKIVADKFGEDTAIVSLEAGTEDVALCTDYVSNIGTIEGEHEVQIHGDDQTVDARNIRLYGKQGPSIGEHPRDWFRDEHVEFGKRLGMWYLNRTDAAEKGEPPMPEDHYRTLLEWADALAEEHPDLTEDEPHGIDITIQEIREDAKFYYDLDESAKKSLAKTDENETPTLDLTHETDATWMNEGSVPPQRERMSESLFEQMVERNRRRRREAAAEDDDRDIGGTPMRLKARAEISNLKNPNEGVDESVLQKAGDNFYQVDDMLIDAWEKQVCADSLEKAPNMWRRDDNVPQFVRTFVLQSAVKRDALWDEYNDVPHMAALSVHEIIKDNLTNPEGWSIKTISNDLTDEFEGISENQAETIARTEVASVLNKARVMAYDASGEELQFYWSGPSDEHTTDICEETKTEIENRGGYVDKDTLKKILRRKARKYQDDGGTPERVDTFVPHFNCRHTLVRSEFRFM